MEINMTQLCDLDFMLDDALACVISIWMVIECKPQLGTKISRSSNQYWMKEHVTESVTLVAMKMAETFHSTHGALGLSILVLSHQEKSLRELCDVIGTIVSISNAIPFNYVGVDKIRRTVILEDFA
ncbi:hypothetical protein Tco_1510043 [Tanacetum coccineum]